MGRRPQRHQHRIHREKNTKRKMRTYDRGEFLDLCASTIETFTQAMRTTAKRVGLSCDFDREYLTDAPDYRSVTQAIFIDLFEQGAVIEDLARTSTTRLKARPSPMPKLSGHAQNQAGGRPLADKDGEEVVISTTRPEMICACGVVVVHPDDDRYRNLVGQTLALPMPTDGREAVVEVALTLGENGVRFRCPDGLFFGDQNDVAVFRELGLDPSKPSTLKVA